MRDLILEYIDDIWELGFELEFEIDQIDVHLMTDDDLFKLFIDIISKYNSYQKVVVDKCAKLCDSYVAMNVPPTMIGSLIKEQFKGKK